MNGSEQRRHTTVTQQLAATVESVASSVSEQGDYLIGLLHEERTHRLKLADEQRAYVDARGRELRTCCQERWDSIGTTTKRLADGIHELRGRGFWSRLNWLITGR